MNNQDRHNRLFQDQSSSSIFSSQKSSIYLALAARRRNLVGYEYCVAVGATKDLPLLPSLVFVGPWELGEVREN